MKVCFIVGSPDISGGTFVIFQHALYMVEQLHFSVDVVCIFPATNENTKWHPDANEKLTFKTFDDTVDEHYDIAILTWWKTVYEAYRVNAERYLYFVQSIESLFYRSNEIPLRKLVDKTYTYGLPVITEATWIRNYLYDQYESIAWLAKNGIRKDAYKPYGKKKEERKKGKLRVLIEGPVDVDFKNVPKTISLCKKSQADELWLLTSSSIETYEGIDKVFSKVPFTETAEIYRSCDLIVKLSYVEGMFGPPLEMFHCGGTAIVYNVTGHDEYIYHNINGLVVKKDYDKKVIDYINLLKEDMQLLGRLKNEAIRAANDWPDWPTSSFVFCKAVNEIRNTTAITNKNAFFGYLKKCFEEYVDEENLRKSQEQ